jgi:hypothetical protein
MKPTLDELIRRASLPIGVKWSEDMNAWFVCDMPLSAVSMWKTPLAATRTVVGLRHLYA